MLSKVPGPRWIVEMYPGYFTLTMATGIISIAFSLLGMKGLSEFMYWVTLATWAVLFCIYTWRLIRYPRAVFVDLMNPRLTFNFFTFVAATDVCGLLFNMHGLDRLALASLVLAFLAWASLLYCSFTVLTLLHEERNLSVMDGGWLIGIVGTQSLVLLGLKLVPQLGVYAPYMILGIYMLWWLGLLLYGIFVTLFCYRIFFLTMSIDDYSPLMWVIMGAAAISANASSTLDMSDPVIHVLYEMHPVVDAIALLTWTLATWWIPLLLVLSFWKYFVRRVPLRYDPRQWSVVFPLGMYTVATFQLSVAAEFVPMHQISHVMVWASAGVWCLMMIGMLSRLGAWLFMGERQER